jgi:HSP20 family protein
MLVRTRRIGVPAIDHMPSMQREMEHLLGRFLNGTSDSGAARGWHAAVAMWDDNDKVFVELELPGVRKDDIELTVHNGMLRVSGERKIPEGNRNYWVNDRAYGPFDRAIALPDDVDAENIDAELSEGVLRIVLSKKPEAQPKKITVKG